MRNNKKTVKFYFKTFEDENHPSILCRVGSQGKKPDPKTAIRYELEPGDTYSSLETHLEENWEVEFKIRAGRPLDTGGDRPKWLPLTAKELWHKVNQVNYILDWCEHNGVRAGWEEDWVDNQELHFNLYLSFKDLYPHIIPEKTFEARPKRHGDKNPRERGRLRKNKL